MNATPYKTAARQELEADLMKRFNLDQAEINHANWSRQEWDGCGVYPLEAWIEDLFEFDEQFYVGGVAAFRAQAASAARWGYGPLSAREEAPKVGEIVRYIGADGYAHSGTIQEIREDGWLVRDLYGMRSETPEEVITEGNFR